MDELRAEAQAILSELVGSDADFRGDQWDAIEGLVDARRRVLVVQRTGWGKSAVYFVATKLLRNRGAGPTLLVSPLLGLMRNQIESGRRGGIRAERITSDNHDEWERVVSELERDEIDILLVSPERFANKQFRSEVLPEVASRVGLLVIDEAHCISDWGHDFRPDYRRLARVLDQLPNGVPVLCTTATANDRVVDDIRAQLGDDLLVLRGPLGRESLVLDVLQLPNPAQRLAWLAATLPKLDGTGIVYTLTVDDARRVAEWLRINGIAARAYSGGESIEARVEIEEQLQNNSIKCVVATSALGMGYDKPDLAFVIHFQVPGSAIAYYQQVGRAGRGIDRAVAVALVGFEDRQIQDWFINTAFPPQEQAEQVVALLTERGDYVGLAELETAVNMRRSRLEGMLKNLEVEGLLERDGRKWRRTNEEWEYPAARVEAVTAQRRAEQDRMSEFLSASGCLMQFLQRELDDPTAAECGKCAGCRGEHVVDASVDPELAQEAVAFLRRRVLEIEPRKQWPDMKRIKPAEQAERGRALSVWSDGGWGSVVRNQKAAGEFGDDLVEALVELVAQWQPDPMPTWVTCVPSRRQPDLVPSFAKRFAAAMGLPFVDAVKPSGNPRPQSEMDNSAQQYGNVLRAFAVTEEVPDGPVFLVDDTFDSRWTLTVVTSQLRGACAGAVFPIALAEARSE